MNKNIVIGGIVAVLVILGVWYISTSSGTVANTQPDTTAGSVTPPAAAPANANTFHSIFTQTGNHKCVFSQVTATGQANSSIVIADGKMRGEFRTVGPVNSANFMIYSDGFLYSWKEGATVGKKSSIKTVADLPQAIPADLTSGANFGTNADNVGWICNDWLKDVTAFSIPTYVKFTAAS